MVTTSPGFNADFSVTMIPVPVSTTVGDGIGIAAQQVLDQLLDLAAQLGLVETEPSKVFFLPRWIVQVISSL